MAVTRRGFLGANLLAGMAVAAGQDAPQPQALPLSRHQNGPKPRSTPALCLYSDQLLKVGYEEMAGMVRSLGFDGVELMVQPGGHIEPEHADLHLERGIEAMTGSGVDVYAVSTSFTSPADPTLRLALEWGGEMGVPVFRPGDWKFTNAEPEARLIEVQREIAALASMARQTGISMAIHNGTADCVGGSVWDLYFILRGLDQRLVGYDFDIGYAAAQGGPAGWRTALRLTLPRLKMVTARDCYWSKEPGAWKLAECPLGEGMVDWPGFLAELARARFAGPISLHLAYSPKDEFAAIRKDQQFLKKQLAAAYGG
jgi:sugar phosphate isomerase/epimerase